MKIERNANNQFSTNFSSYKNCFYHATSSLASAEIEKVGILPSKVFGPVDHQAILYHATSLNIDVTYYQQWLLLRSITFAKNQADALSHLTNGNSGGQGLVNMENVLKDILKSGTANQRNLAQNYINEINNIRTAGSVIYAVDLSSNINKSSFEQAPLQKHLYRLSFPYDMPLPKVSMVTPHDLIARLDVR